MNYVHFSLDSKLCIFNGGLYTLTVSLVCVCPLVYMCTATLGDMLSKEIQGAGGEKKKHLWF
jgi:hypothetical protein